MLKALQPPSASASRFHRFQAAGVTAIPGRAVTHTCQGPAGAGDAEKGLSSLAGSSLPSTGGQRAAARGGGCGERGCRRFVWAGSPHVPPADPCKPPQLCRQVWGAVSPHGWGSSRGLPRSQHCSPLGLYLPLPAASHQVAFTADCELLVWVQGGSCAPPACQGCPVPPARHGAGVCFGPWHARNLPGLALGSPAPRGKGPSWGVEKWGCSLGWGPALQDPSLAREAGDEVPLCPVPPCLGRRWEACTHAKVGGFLVRYQLLICPSVRLCNGGGVPSPWCVPLGCACLAWGRVPIILCRCPGASAPWAAQGGCGTCSGTMGSRRAPPPPLGSGCAGRGQAGCRYLPWGGGRGSISPCDTPQQQITGRPCLPVSPLPSLAPPLPPAHAFAQGPPGRRGGGRRQTVLGVGGVGYWLERV